MSTVWWLTSLKNSSISEGLKSLSGEVHACTIYPEYMNDPAHNNNPYKMHKHKFTILNAKMLAQIPLQKTLAQS